MGDEAIEDLVVDPGTFAEWKTAIDNLTEELRKTRIGFEARDRRRGITITLLALTLLVFAVVGAALFWNYTTDRAADRAEVKAAAVRACEQTNDARSTLRSAIGRSNRGLELALQTFAGDPAADRIIAEIKAENAQTAKDLAKDLPIRDCAKL